MVRRAQRDRDNRAAPYTLPLFDGEVSGRRRYLTSARRLFSTPLEMALHIYWSSGVEAHALGALAARTELPDQRRALTELQQMEERQKALAAYLLETIWRIKVPGSPKAVADTAGDDIDSGSVA
jgi:hypothetical protein